MVVIQGRKLTKGERPSASGSEYPNELALSSTPRSWTIERQAPHITKRALCAPILRDNCCLDRWFLKEELRGTECWCKTIEPDGLIIETGEKRLVEQQLAQVLGQLSRSDELKRGMAGNSPERRTN